MNEQDFDKQLEFLGKRVKDIFICADGEQRKSMIESLLEIAARLVDMSNVQPKLFTQMADEAWSKVKRERWVKE